MSDKPKKPIYYNPALNDDEQHARLEAADIAIGEFWNEQYQLGEWIRLTRIADWIVSRGNPIPRDEMLIDEPARAVYLKLSRAVRAGFFKSQTILVSTQWPLEGGPDDEVAARMAITIDEFRDASRLIISDRWIVPTAEIDQFISTYLQNMAVTNRACSEWLSREAYDLPPWLKAVTGNQTLSAAAAEPDRRPEVEAPPPKKPRGRRPGDGSFAPLDLPILDEMKELIAARGAASPEEAARLLRGKAHGSGTLESITSRLAKRYRRREGRC